MPFDGRLTVIAVLGRWQFTAVHSTGVCQSAGRHYMYKALLAERPSIPLMRVNASTDKVFGQLCSER